MYPWLFKIVGKIESTEEKLLSNLRYVKEDLESTFLAIASDIDALPQDFVNELAKFHARLESFINKTPYVEPEVPNAPSSAPVAIDEPVVAPVEVTPAPVESPAIEPIAVSGIEISPVEPPASVSTAIPVSTTPIEQAASTDTVSGVPVTPVAPVSPVEPTPVVETLVAGVATPAIPSTIDVVHPDNGTTITIPNPAYVAPVSAPVATPVTETLVTPSVDPTPAPTVETPVVTPAAETLSPEAIAAAVPPPVVNS